MNLAERDCTSDRLGTPPPEPATQLLRVRVDIDAADFLIGTRVRDPQPRQRPEISIVASTDARGPGVISRELASGRHLSFARDDRA
jgi:hypothetical protein